jgi:hypothetical protein
MAKGSRNHNRNHPAPLTDEQIRAHTIGEPQPLAGRILVVDYDPRWPELFQREAERVFGFSRGLAVRFFRNS